MTNLRKQIPWVARGICTSCDAKRMLELGAHICDSVIGELPVRQFVVTLPPAYRGVLAWNADLRGKVLKAVMTALRHHYLAQAYHAGANDPQFAAISVLQRFSGAIRIWPHFHVLCPDGAWAKAADGQRIFVPAPHLDDEALWLVVAEIASRVERIMDRHCDALRKATEAAGRDDDEDPWQAAQPALARLMRQSLFGKDELEALQLPKGKGLTPATPRVVGRLCMDVNGYNVHAATTVASCARDRLEHLVRYVCRPVIAAKRLEEAGNGRVRIWLKNEWKGGKNAVVMPRREFATRILAQVPLPRRPNIQYFGLWAPAAKARALVVPALGARVEHNKRRGKRKHADQCTGPCECPDPEHHHDACGHVGQAEQTEAAKAKRKSKETRLTWSQALQRGFGIKIEKCPCGGRRKLIAAILDKGQVERILRHVKLWPTKDVNIVAIRGPPHSFDDAIDDAPGEQFDGVDDRVEADWAA